MYKVALYDTDKKIISQMEYFFKIHVTNFELNIFENGEELLESLKNSEYYELIILGIGLTSGNNGITLAQQIRQLDVDSNIVFISNLECYYYEAFEVEPLRFYKKPIDWKRFKGMLQVLTERLDKTNKYFFFKKENAIHKIRISDIIYFESQRRIINIVTKQGEFSYYDKLDSVEEYIKKRNNNFIRIHKSFFVNSYHITKFEYAKVHMDNDAILPISENKRIKIRDEFMEFIGGSVCGRSKSC
ncbi:two-component response regulator [Lachnospiraceae bacterium KM106-2]|nr:two-component response regulator [Lachnospiraceae bacterium KM106-2]